MDVTASIDAECPSGRLFAAVEDIGTYPEWLHIVTRAVPAPGVDGDPGPAWLVDLRGRLGPLARSKRLRMVRTELDAGRIRFERRELDDRDHSPWVLEAEVETVAIGTSRVTMRLHYGGTFGGSLLRRMLLDEIDASKPRLLARVAPGTT